MNLSFKLLLPRVTLWRRLSRVWKKSTHTPNKQISAWAKDPPPNKTTSVGKREDKTNERFYYIL